MITDEKVFGNIFDNEDIIPSRLYLFADDTYGKFTAANKANIYTPILTLLLAPKDALKLEIGEVKSTLGVQKGSTFTVDTVIKGFKLYMSENEGVIAKAVGGKKTATFLEFYPNGVDEYSRATKTKLPALLKQITDAAEKNKLKF